jgi:2-methylcitrate dehydratase PrpD
MATTLTHQLANYACPLRSEDLSAEVVHEVERRVIESAECALGTWHEERAELQVTLHRIFG